MFHRSIMAGCNIVCVLFLFIPLLAAVNVPFEDCGSSYYVESISLSGCGSYPCRLKIGSSVNVTTNLLIRRINFNSAESDQKVYFIVSKIRLEVQVSPDPCGAIRAGSQQLLSSCTIKVGERVAYEATVNVRGVPPLPATLFWMIKNKATGDQVVCYRTTVLLTAD